MPNFWGIFLEFLWYLLDLGWYFDGILLVFWWNFLGIFCDYTSQKSNEKGLTTNLTSIFVEFFMYLLILLYPKEHGQIRVVMEINWYFDAIFILLALLIETLAEVKSNYINEKGIIFSWHWLSIRWTGIIKETIENKIFSSIFNCIQIFTHCDI